MCTARISSLSCDMLSVAAVPAVEVSDGFHQFPVLLEWWMCVHTARGDRREGVSTWFSLDFVKGFQLDVQRATCFRGRSSGLAQMWVQWLSATNYLRSSGQII